MIHVTRGYPWPRAALLVTATRLKGTAWHSSTPAAGTFKRSNAARITPFYVKLSGDWLGALDDNMACPTGETVMLYTALIWCAKNVALQP